MLGCLFITVLCQEQSDWLKNSLIRSFGIGCWIRRARYKNIFQKKLAVAAVVAHIFKRPMGFFPTYHASPDTKPKIEFSAKFKKKLREIHFVSRNNLVEIEEGLASNPLQCNVFWAEAVGRSENPGDLIKIEFPAKF